MTIDDIIMTLCTGMFYIVQYVYDLFLSILISRKQTCVGLLKHSLSSRDTFHVSCLNKFTSNHIKPTFWCAHHTGILAMRTSRLVVILAVKDGCLVSITLNIVHMNRSKTTAKASVRPRLDRSAKPELVADDHGVIHVPEVVANRAPFVVDVDFDAALEDVTADETKSRAAI